jgi:hypothetical protein
MHNLPRLAARDLAGVTAEDMTDDAVWSTFRECGCVHGVVDLIFSEGCWAEDVKKNVCELEHLAALVRNKAMRARRAP